MNFLRLSFLLFALLCAVSSAIAQTPTPHLKANPIPFDFYARGPYRDDIPRPSKLLGYEPGQFHTTYANYEKVLREIAAKSDRVKVIERERTNEYRTMYLVAISSPENLARLDRIKANTAKLADPRTLATEAEAEAIVKETPIVVWLAYTIHGNESSGFEAGMHVLYELAASTNPKVVELLKNTVVLINPLQNPDGHERFATWYNAVGIGRPEPFAYEHREPWSIQGRMNHYYFDLNRDLLASSQVESRSAMKAFLDWHPQVAADHHGQTTNFFFPPASLPINPNLGKGTAEKWLDVFGRGNAAAFDRYGWNYYVRDVFDLFYPGYWDSWPALNGATGMTYETDGGGWKGLNWLRDDNTILTFADGIAKHVTASFATVETAAANREARLRDYLAYYRQALETGTTGPIKHFVLPPGSDPGRTADLVALLLRNGIEVKRASAGFTLKNVHDYLGGTQATREFPAGSYIVSLNQPQGRLAKAFLELDTPPDADFAKRQVEKRERNRRKGANDPKDESEFYDITAWSLPLARGVEAYWSDDATGATGDFVVGVDGTKLTLSATAKGPGERTAPVPTRAGVTARAKTAYVFVAGTDAGARLTLDLLREGYKIAMSARPLRAGGNDYPAGALIARTDRNPESLHGRIAELATTYGVGVDAIDTAYTDKGITGIGSEAVVTLKAPKVAVIADDAVNQLSYGALWFMLSKDFNVEFVPIRIGTFKRLKMSEFNVLILPDGSPFGYKEEFGKAGIEKLKSWCRDGGTLICFGGASAFAADKEVDLTGARLVDGQHDEEKDEEKPDEPMEKPAAPKKDDKKKDTKKKDAASAKPVEKPQEDQRKEDDGDVESEPLPVPGAIFKAKVNREHYLAFGYDRDDFATFVNSERFFTMSKTGTNVVTFAGDKLRLAGFIWEGNTERLLRDTAHVIDEQVGEGHVLIFAEDPNYRYIWHAGKRFFLNGLIYSPTIGFSTGLK